jgi:hypothetical protein
MRDLDLISGNFLEGDVPKAQRYLTKYFKTIPQKAFVKYYLAFRSCERFTEHTGHVASIRWLRELADRLEKLEREWQAARLIGDFERLAVIESGKAKNLDG